MRLTKALFIGRDNWLEPEEWGKLAEGTVGNSNLRKIEDFPWSEDILKNEKTVKLQGRLIHDECSGSKSPSFIVFVKLLQHPSAASITELDLRLNSFPNLAVRWEFYSFRLPMSWLQPRRCKIHLQIYDVIELKKRIWIMLLLALIGLEMMDAKLLFLHFPVWSFSLLWTWSECYVICWVGVLKFDALLSQRSFSHI